MIYIHAYEIDSITSYCVQGYEYHSVRYTTTNGKQYIYTFFGSLKHLWESMR